MDTQEFFHDRTHQVHSCRIASPLQQLKPIIGMMFMQKMCACKPLTGNVSIQINFDEKSLGLQSRNILLMSLFVQSDFFFSLSV